MNRIRLGLIVLFGAALGLAGYVTFVKAPRLEAKIAAAVANLDQNSRHNVYVVVDGRDITLSGLAQDAAEREELTSRAAQVFGRRVVNDRLDVLQVATPYLLTVRLNNGRRTILGNVPSEDLRLQLGESVKANPRNLALAAGAPDENWLTAIVTAAAALDVIENGEIVFSDQTIRIVGTAKSPFAQEDVAAIFGSLPAGYTGDQDISVPLVKPFTFNITKNESELTFRGNVQTRAQAATIRSAISGAQGSLEPALGAPDADWSEAVTIIAKAMDLTETGEANLIDQDVAFRSTAASLEISDQIQALLLTLPESYKLTTLAVDVPPAIPYVFEGTKSGSGIVYSGYVPNDIVRSTISETIGEEAAGQLERRAGMPDGFWPEFVAEAVATLGALEQGRVQIEGRTLRVTGVAANPVLAQAIEAALSDLPAGYAAEFDLELEDDGQPTFIALAYEIGKPTALSGKAPADLDAEMIRTLLDVDDISGALRPSVLSGSGFYADRLRSLRNILPAFQLFNVTFSETDTKISGVLRTAQDPEAVQNVLISTFGETAIIDLQSTPSDIEEGAIRTNELTGILEIFRGRVWQTFATEQELIESCSARVETVLFDTKILFATGSAQIDPASIEVLNELSAIVEPCLNNSTARIVLGGHTDNQGDGTANSTLSEARANAVRDALLERGIPATRITASGFGDTKPIATNDSAEGRAANRRTTFDWKIE